MFTSTWIIAVKEFFKCLPPASDTHRHGAVDKANKAEFASIAKLSTIVSSHRFMYTNIMIKTTIYT